MEKIKYLLVLIVFLIAGCGSSKNEDEKVLLFAGYSAAREAFKKVIPVFEVDWFEKTGQRVQVKQSYSSSGTQSRAIVAGFEADVAALAVEVDIERLVQEKLVLNKWKKNWGGMVTKSAVVFVVRQGNPLEIKQWSDLLNEGVELLMPNPKTSGGAQWNVLSAYGAALKGKVSGYATTSEGGKDFLKDLIAQVTVMDKGARESIINYEFGAGNVAVTYESEALVGREKGETYEVVVPSSSVIVENPVAVVDVYADKHGVRSIADGFVQFLFSEKAQRLFAETGFRPVRPEVENEFKNQFPFIPDYWQISYLGSWDKVMKGFFGTNGVYTLAVEEVRNK